MGWYIHGMVCHAIHILSAMEMLRFKSVEQGRLFLG